MSELKAIYAYTADEIESLCNRAKGNEYYLKSEVDKVIAEQKNRIAPKQSDKTLQERLNEVFKKHGVSTLQDLDWAFCESEKRRSGDNIEAAEQLRYHKYKRCLAVAKWCKLKRIDAANYRIPRCKWEFYDKWHKRWLELAERFEEAK